MKASPTPIILFIDEAHTMIGAGGAAGQGDAANLLKPALARGELRTLAATTWSEYKKYFEKDPALARRFVQQVLSMRPEDAPALRAVQDDAIRGLAMLVASRQQRGELAADIDPALAAANSFLLYYGVLTGWLSGWIPDARPRDQTLRACVTMHWRGLEGPEAPAARRTR